MKITLFPFLYETVEEFPVLDAYVEGDKITINNQEFDFSPILEGFRLPAEAIDSNAFVKGSNFFVERRNGELFLTLYLPALWRSPESIRTPRTPLVISINKGKVVFPDVMPQLEEITDFEPKLPAVEVPDFMSPVEPKD